MFLHKWKRAAHFGEHKMKGSLFVVHRQALPLHDLVRQETDTQSISSLGDAIGPPDATFTGIDIRDSSTINFVVPSRHSLECLAARVPSTASTASSQMPLQRDAVQSFSRRKKSRRVTRRCGCPKELSCINTRSNCTYCHKHLVRRITRNKVKGVHSLCHQTCVTADPRSATS